MISEKDLEVLPKVLTFWDQLDDNQKELLTKYAENISYNKEDRIYGGGNDCVGVLIIKKGDLRVYLLSDEGKEITLYKLEEGDVCILSASCILSQITFEVHIDAVSDCEMIKISPTVYDRICKENIHADNFTNNIIIERFSDIMWAMQQILFFSIDKRLAIFLYDEMISNKSNKIKLTHNQIAKYVGSAREVITRMLNYFSDEGIVSLARGVVEITDKQKLKELTH